MSISSSKNCVIGARLKDGVNQSDSIADKFVWENESYFDFKKSIKNNNSTDFKIFWWNIKMGELGVLNNDKDRWAIDSNLIALAQSPLRPNLLILAEYTFSALNRHTEKHLSQIYPYQKYIALNKIEKFPGIKIYSSGPMDLMDTLSLPGGNSWYFSKQRRSFHDRTSPWIQIKWEEKNLHIFPLHLMNPWVDIEDLLGFPFKYFFIGNEIFNNDTGPLSRQASFFLKSIANVRKLNIKEDNIIIIGDFNTPKKIGPIYSNIYKHMTRFFDDAYNCNTATFPAKSASENDHYPQMKIDHCFLSERVDKINSHTLPFKGSDHYPLLIVTRLSR